MTRTEVAEMIEFAMACYPKTQIKDMKKMLDVWSEMFAGINADKAMDKMKRNCRELKWFPSVADVLEGQKDWSKVK